VSIVDSINSYVGAVVVAMIWFTLQNIITGFVSRYLGTGDRIQSRINNSLKEIGDRFDNRLTAIEAELKIVERGFESKNLGYYNELKEEIRELRQMLFATKQGGNNG
jgi:hypothetical protein